MTPTTDLDRIDIKIIQELAEEGRMPWRELAERIGLSLTPTLRRVKRLEDDGYILGYATRLNESLLIGGMSVFVSVTLEKQVEEALVQFEREISQAPQVMSCFLMTGDADYILRVVVRDLAEYQSFMSGTLTRIKGVAHIKSSFALKQVMLRAGPVVTAGKVRKKTVRG